MAHSVALIDDHHLVRTGIAGMVNETGTYHVTIEAGNGREFIEALNGVPEPAIAIVDLHMPVMNGFETIAWIKQHTPNILPLALTFDAADEVMLRAVRAGARGFLLKSAHPPVLKIALDSLMLTGYYHNDDLNAVLVERRNLMTDHERQQAAILQSITPREAEFLKLVCQAEELTYEQIARKMDIQPRTADGMRDGLMKKYNLKSKTGLVLFAMKWGIVQP